MPTRRGGHRDFVLAWLVGAAALGCGDGQGPGASPKALAEQQTSLPALIVSDPAGSGAAVAGISRAALVEPVSYLSLAPGSVSDAERVLLTNLTTGAGASAEVVAGGFDPVPLPASIGDSLSIRIQPAGDGPTRFVHAKAPPRRAPAVVRSDPLARHSDVPLNTRILVVFSEPMSEASLADSSMYLLRDGVLVPGTLSFADSAHLSIAFSPADPLDGGARYLLRVTPAATDADGETLGENVEVEFTTRPGTSTPAQAGAWRAIASLPLPVENPGVAVHNGTVYVFGGYGYSATGPMGGVSSAILAYDPARDAWRTAGTLAHPVFGPGAAVVGDRIYVIGGYNHSEGYVAHVQVFDPASGTVVPGPPLPRARAGVAVAVVDGRIHVFGGEYAEPGSPNDMIQPLDHDALDPVAGTWSSRAPRRSGLRYMGAVVMDERIYAIAHGEVELYDADVDSWTSVGSIPLREGPLVAALSGAIYVAGGIVSDPIRDPAFSASVLRFDPATRAVEPVADMVYARAHASLVEVNGVLLALGGDHLQGTAEMFRVAP